MIPEIYEIKDNRPLGMDRLGRKHLHHKILYWIDKNGCFICSSHARNRTGYPGIRIDGKTLTVARYLYSLKFPISEKECIRHICDNRECINIKHLIRGTKKENMQDCVQRGRTSRGSKHPFAKLTESQVIEIRQSKETGKSLARKYRIGEMEISRIKRNYRWGWLN